MTTEDDTNGGFLARWSRRKAEAREGSVEVPAPPPEPAPVDLAREPEPPIDLEALPPVESLGADSDYTQFLRRGVPSTLTNAALRRAWTSDPFISTFREMADYDWDFNAPGYFDLRPDDNVEELIARLYAPPAAAVEAAEPDAAPESQMQESVAESAPCGGPPQELPAPSISNVAAMQHEPVALDNAGEMIEADVRRPRHGGALPL